MSAVHSAHNHRCSNFSSSQAASSLPPLLKIVFHFLSNLVVLLKRS